MSKNKDFRLLLKHIEGNTKTTLIVNCSPHIFNVEETVSTLRFAQRAKSITNSVSINQKRSVEELELIVKVSSHIVLWELCYFT